VNVAGAGDVVTVTEGTYSEAVVVTSGGLAGSPLRIEASGAVALVGPGGATTAGMTLDASYVEVVGLDISGFDTGLSIARGKTQLVLRQLSLHGNGRGIFIDRATGVVLEDSNSLDNCTDGVRAVGTSRNLTFRRVVAVGNGSACAREGDGFYLAPEVTNVLLEDCRAEANSGDGFDTRSDRTTLRRVVSLGNADHGVRLERGATVEVSLIANNGTVGLEISGTQAATLSVAASTIAGQPIALLLGPAGQPISASLLGNVLSATGKVIEYQETVTLSEDYDLIFRTSPALPHIVRKLGGATTASYTGTDINGGLWTAATGQGAHSFAADPLFVGAGAAPFGLKAASPAVDAGPPAGVPSTDLLGVARPHGGGVDMGAFERVGGVTFYVSPSGDDTGAGTAADPFLTIGRAAAVAAAGDTVVIRAGDYYEAVELTVSGLPGAPIDFFAEPGARLLSPLPDPLGGPDGVTVGQGVGLVTISGLRIGGGFRRGIYLRNGSHDVALSGLEVTGNGTGVLLEGASNVLLDGIQSSDNCSHGIAATSGSRALTVRNAASAGNGACSPQGDGIFADESTADIAVEDSSATGNAGEGFDLRGSGVTMSGSRSLSNQKDGIKLVAGGSVENCLSSGNGTVGLELTGQLAGASLRIASSTFADNSIGILLGPAGQPASVEMVNNIIAGSGKLLEFQDTVALTENYDLFFRDPSSLPHIMKKRGGTQLAAYNASDINGGAWAAAGGGSQSRASDPRFVRLGPEPYQLRLDSPALDAGLASEAPATDIAGTPRPQLARVDLGAYERPEGASFSYYVAPDGSDSGDGSMASPLRSITLALGFAGPGDSVILLPGTYREEVTVSGSGASGAEIVLLGEAGQVFLEGAGGGVGLEVADGVGHVQVVGITIRNFATGVLLAPGSHDVTLGQVEAINNSGVGFEIDGGVGVLIENSRAAGNCGHGIEVTAGSADIAIGDTESSSNGVSCGSASDGFHVSGLASDVAISRSLAIGNAGDGFDLRGANMSLSRAQAWDNADRGVKAERSAEVETALLARNKVGIELTGSFAGGSLLVRSSTIFTDGSYGLLIGAGGQPVSATIVNSIIAGSAKSLEYQVRADLTEHHNLYYRSAAGSSHIVVKDGGSTVAQFAANAINDGSWSAYSGQGQGSMATDPLFAAPDFGDFSLRRASPAVDAGDNAAAPGADLMGNARPMGLAVDIGAIERPPPTSLYVAPDGSDDNPGTASAPFATLQRAANLTGPGYEVVVRPGVYRQVLAISESGAPSDAIVFTFEPGARLAPPAGSQTAVRIAAGVGHIEISGLVVDRGFARGIVAEPGAHDLTIISPHIAGASEGVVLDAVANVAVQGGVVSESCADGVRITGASHDIVLTDVESTENGSGCPGTAAGFYVESTASNVTFRRCQSRRNTGSGFDTAASGAALLQCIASDNGNIGIRSSGVTRVENCLSTVNGNFGILGAGSSLEIVNCTVADNGGGVLLTGGSATMVNSIVAGANKTLEFQEGVSLTEHHNILYRKIPTAAHIVLKRGSQTLASYNADDINGGRWRSESATGAATIARDPAFGNPPIGVYSLRSFSPAVDSASAAEAPASDITGKSRPLGAEVDRGAYERAVTGGTLYLVSPDGSDAGDGSEANPWRSLTRALSEAGPADVVRVMPGIYQETVQISFGGTSDDPLVIEGEPGAVLASPDPGQPLVGITVSGGASDLEIRGLEIGSGFDRGLWVLPGASRVVLADLAVHSNNEGIVIDGASDVLLDGGASRSNCVAGLRITGAARNIAIVGTSSEETGVACGRFGAGFTVGAEARDVTFEGALARGNSENGFDVKARQARLRGIVAENNGNIGLRVEHDARAENVIVAGNGNVGAVVAAGDSEGGSLTLLNATIAQNTVGVLAGASTVGPVNLVLVNSILAGEGKLLEYQQSATLVEHHNLYYRLPATASHIVRKDGGTTLAAYNAAAINSGLWQAESGQGAASLAGDPRFIDPANHLFWLRADSPAVDSGSAEDAPPQDLLGRLRPLGSEVDRGAYERSSSGGGTYYVAADGSDTGDGSAEAPYATLQRALDMAAPGDTIVLRPGIHSRSARIEVGGSEIFPITVEAEPGAIMDASSGEPAAAAISVGSGIGHVILRGLAIQGSWPAGVALEPGSHDVTIDQVSVLGARRGIALAGALRVSISGVTATDNCDAGIAIEAASSEVVLGSVRGTRNGVSCGDLADAVFSDASTSKVTVSDSSFSENTEGGVDLRGRESTVRRVTAFANGEAGVRVDDGLVENCVSYGNAAAGIASVGREDGGAVEIRNCTFHDNGIGVRLGEPVRNNALSAVLENSIISGTGTLVEAQQSVSLGEDYNVYYRTNAFLPHIVVKDLWRTVGAYNAGDINSGAWTSASGQGTHSRSADPLFVDPQAALFELHEASLAVDFASAAKAPVEDLVGKPRPQGSGWDAGALEHVPCAQGGTFGCRPLPPPPAPPPGSARVSFVIQDVGVGSAPMGGALADFNRDGHLDLAVANSGDDTVHVLMGNGSGGFKAVAALAVGVRPRGLAAGDLNGDGAPDLAVANQTSDDVYLMFGDGEGRFSLGARLIANQAPVGAAIADLDLDGRNDLVVVNMDSDDLSVFLNRGSGTLSLPTNYRTGSGPLFVAVGDLNHDGSPDLAVANRKSDNVSVLLGDGTGRFGPPSHFLAGEANRAVAIADLDGDGNSDLVAASRRSNGASVLFGDGAGSFLPATLIATGSTPNSVAGADLNGDGRGDFVVADTGDDRVSVVLSLVGGGFAPPKTLPVGDHPSTVLTGDLDEDGQLDIVTVNREARSVTVLLGDGAGGTRPNFREIPAGLRPVALATGDVDGDGKVDAIVADADGESLRLIRRVGGLSETEVIALSGSRPRDLVLADFDGDGISDLAVSDEAGARVALFRGDGSGFELAGFVESGGRPAGLAAADLNGDGAVDLAIADASSRRVMVMLGDGAGGFASSGSVRVGSRPTAVKVLDANQDGIADLAVIHERSHALRFELGNGDGTFRRWRTSSVAKMPTSVAMADLNRDGLQDLVVGNSRFAYVTSVWARGQGRFTRKKVEALEQPTGVAAADFDGDGTLDLAVTSQKNDQVGILLGDGANFALAAVYPVGHNPSIVTSSDINDDGKPDLLVLNRSSATISVLTNYSP